MLRTARSRIISVAAIVAISAVGAVGAVGWYTERPKTIPASFTEKLGHDLAKLQATIEAAQAAASR